MKESGEIADDINDIYRQTNIDYMNMVSEKPIHINQIACALSHVKIYEYIKDKNSLLRREGILFTYQLGHSNIPIIKIKIITPTIHKVALG